MAKEYIEREAAIAHPFANGHYDHEHASEDYIRGHEDYREWLEQLPAADVRPVVHAHWEIANKTYDEDGTARWRCSNCKSYRWYGKKPTHIKFCEKCGAQMGADMREVQDG